MTDVPSLRDWLATGTGIAALAGGLFSVYKFVVERQKDRRQRDDELIQRRTELRWHQERPTLWSSTRTSITHFTPFASGTPMVADSKHGE